MTPVNATQPPSRAERLHRQQCVWAAGRLPKPTSEPMRLLWKELNACRGRYRHWVACGLLLHALHAPHPGSLPA